MISQMVRDNLKLPLVLNREYSEIHRNHIMVDVHEAYPDMDLEKILPPLFFKDVESLSEDEVVLLDNFIYVYKWFRNIE